MEKKKKFPTLSEFVKFLVAELNIAYDSVNIKVGKNNASEFRTRLSKTAS
jgi:uncharacterized protein Usg